MNVEEASGYCKACNRQRMIRRKGTNHILHLLLTIITCGFWFIIWILSAIKFGGWRCTQCGRKVRRTLFG